ncbi:MAG: DUF58 domain-containing protein [Chitinophagaceae bacterium]
MSQLLDPKVLMAIKDLSLTAKTTVDGFLAGINKSAVKGPGLEFSQYRSYQPGDDLRWLDWKMYARSDRYYIRESEIETSISVKFLVDASGSMNHSDGSFIKIEYAKYLAASLAYLANISGDYVGLNIFQDGKLFSLASRQDHQHMSRLFFQLENITPGGKFTEAVGYRDLFSGAQRKELLVFITDFYEHDNEIMHLLDNLSSLKHEIIVFQLLARNELELNYKGYAAVQDLETGESIRLNNDVSRNTYKHRLQEYLSSLRIQLLDRNISYRLVVTDQALEQALRDFLNQRNKLRA